MDEEMQTTIDEIMRNELGNWMVSFLLILYQRNHSSPYPCNDEKETVYFHTLGEIFDSPEIFVSLERWELVKVAFGFTSCEDGSLSLIYNFSLTEKGRETAEYIISEDDGSEDDSEDGLEDIRDKSDGDKI